MHKLKGSSDIPKTLQTLIEEQLIWKILGRKPLSTRDNQGRPFGDGVGFQYWSATSTAKDKHPTAEEIETLSRGD